MASNDKKWRRGKIARHKFRKRYKRDHWKRIHKK